MKLFFFTLLTTLSFYSVAHAQQETHGGDGFALEFLQAYTELRAHFTDAEIPMADGRQFSVQALDRIRPKLKIISSAKVYWNDQEVSARNTPSQYLVELSQSHWVLLNFEQKIALVLHEVLPIAGWVDDDYVVSTTLLKHLSIQPGKTSIEKIADGLLSCKTGVLQSLSAGLYQSFLPVYRADMIHLAVLAGCPYYLNKAVQFSSLSEVQTTCDREDGNTPFEALVHWTAGSLPTEEGRYHQMFEMIFRGPQDAKLYCKSANGFISKGSACDVLKKYKHKNKAYFNHLEKKAGCR